MSEKQSTRITTDHNEIRMWVESKGGKPAKLKGAGDGDIGSLRIDFVEDGHEDLLEEISWDEFFKEFDEGRLAFLYQEEAQEGNESKFFKLVSRN